MCDKEERGVGSNAPSEEVFSSPAWNVAAVAEAVPSVSLFWLAWFAGRGASETERKV